MDEKNQIEEMAVQFAKINCNPKGCYSCDLCDEYCSLELSCEDYLYYRKIAETFYNAGYRKQSEWISVDERLPEPNEECLVSARVGDRVVIDLGELIPYCDGRIFGWMITNDWDEGEGCKITHWMPLPEAPKMKGGAEK